jgi:hypothetical protein
LQFRPRGSIFLGKWLRADLLCGQSSWLQIQRPGLDSRRYHIFWEVVGMERGPLSTIQELLERKNSGFGLEIENTASGIRHADHVALFIRK